MITPVTILTGFLGSGKTTLLARILADPRFADTAVVVNEWGAISIDHAILREASGAVVELPGGCICCRVAGDIVRTLRELHFLRAGGRVAPFRRVVIETTGMADPGPLAATLVEMPVAAVRYALSGIVATVDGVKGMATLDEFPEAVKQVAMADRIAITKADLATAEALAQLESRVRRLAPAARSVRSARGDADAALLLDTGLYRGEGIPMDARGWLSAGEYRPAGRAQPPRHDARITSFVWSTPEPLRWDDVEQALETACALLGGRILRLKGLVQVAGEAGPRAVHAVGHTLYPSARLAAWPDADRATRVVAIGRDLEESALVRILESSLPASHPR